MTKILKCFSILQIFWYFFTLSHLRFISVIGCEQDADAKPIKAKRLKPVVEALIEDPDGGWWTASKKWNTNNDKRNEKKDEIMCKSNQINFTIDMFVLFN